MKKKTVKTCAVCGKPLTRDEYGVVRKLVDMDPPPECVLCLPHFAEYMETDVPTLEIIIENAKAGDCAAFR